jgi:hypothetical protein
MMRMKEGCWDESNQEQPHLMTFDEVIHMLDPIKEPIDFQIDQKPYLANSQGNCLKVYTWTFSEINQWSTEATRPK